MTQKKLISGALNCFQVLPIQEPQLATMKIGWGGAIRLNTSIGGEPLRINSTSYAKGWGDHGQSRHLVQLPRPGKRFSATVGVNPRASYHSQAQFIVEAPDGTELARSPRLGLSDAPYEFSCALNGLTNFILRSIDVAFPEDYDDALNPPNANFNWCNPCIELADGSLWDADEVQTNQALSSIGPKFQYGGQDFFPARKTICPLGEDDDVARWMIEEHAQDGNLTLRTKLQYFKRYAVLEWSCEFHNSGNAPSQIVSDFQAVYLRLNAPLRYVGDEYPLREVAIRQTLGSKNLQTDFITSTAILRERYGADQLHYDTDEGRSSAAWLPFFGIDLSAECGINAGIGWSGAWQADFSLNNQLSFQAGMLKTHFRVLPGETLRQPGIFLHFREGISVEAGQNQLRQFLLKYHSPQGPDGKPLATPFPLSQWGGMPNDRAIKTVRAAAKAQLPYDVVWVDAGWYGPDRPVTDSEYNPQTDWCFTVGDWRVNQVPHPGGFKPLAEAIHAAGMKFLLWVEIERIMPGTPVANEHPEWILTCRIDPGNLLLNLGNPDACDWAIETISRLVREEHIDHYRQDFNFNTIPYWQEADAPDRVGVAEMQYITGLYRFWDTLRERFPGMLIDNCASGGRRIDFETNSRSICLWRSDLLGRPWFDCSECNHTEIGYLTQWVPLHAGGTTVVPGDDYGYLSGVASGVSGGMTEFSDDYDFAWQRQVMKAAQRMMKLFYGDFYLLTPQPEVRENFYAYQCDDPDSGNGFFIVFRRPQTVGGEFTANLRGIVPEQEYLLERHRGESRKVSGAELAAFNVELPDARTCALYFYSKV